MQQKKIDQLLSPATPFSARHLDVVAFAKAGATLEGAAPLSHYRRLTHEQTKADAVPQVHWKAHGKSVEVPGGKPEIWLLLTAEASVPTQCQRCLEPMLQQVVADRAFRFVADEAAAELLDEEIEEDVLVYQKDFDLLELVEDELLMALPVAPRHANCPHAPVMQTQTADFVQEDAPKAHPFAMLEALKKKPGNHG